MDEARFSKDGCGDSERVEGEVSPIRSCGVRYHTKLLLIGRRIGCTRYVGTKGDSNTGKNV